MAILPMRRISIYGLKKDRKAILEALQRRGVVEVTDADTEEYPVEKLDTSTSQATFAKGSATAENALSILSSYVPEDKSMFDSLKGKRELSKEEYYTFVDETDEIMRIASKIGTLSKEISESKAEIIRYEAQMESLSPWLDFDVPLSFKGTRKTTAFIGAFPEEKSLDDILTEYALAVENAKLDADNLAIDANIVSSSPEQTCVFIICHSRSAESVESILRAMGFAKPPFSSKTSPAENIENIKREITKLTDGINDKENEIISYVGMRNAFKFMSDYYTMRADKYKILAQSNQFRRTFMITGYIPEREAEALEKELSLKYNAAIETEAVADDEEAPVLLENNAFAAPMEGVLETYSMPQKGEIDPCTMMAFFYYVLFGLMFSDAAYGAIMAIGCGVILAKFKNMSSGLKKSLQLFMYCGISTAFWGILFGGYFGDVVKIVSTTFFHKEVTIPPLWFEPIKEPMRMLIFSFALGVVHLFAGLGVSFYQNVKQGKWKDAIYDSVFWYMLVGGLIVYLMSTEIFISMAQITFTMPAIAVNIAIISAILGAVGIILTGGRESKNPAKRLAKGLYALYNVTGYLSDILSYSRLLALGLATGVIASVFNMMGAMMGDGILGMIGFIIVFVVGHTVNFGINILGAYVHTNRLMFVEFFGKFYEGGGRKYEPYAENTKYFNIKEEI